MLRSEFIGTHISRLLLAFLIVSFSTLGRGQYSLTVEASPASDPALGTTYRFYVNLQNSSDQISAVYGNNQSALIIEAPNGVEIFEGCMQLRPLRQLGAHRNLHLPQ